MKSSAALRESEATLQPMTGDGFRAAVRVEAGPHAYYEADVSERNELVMGGPGRIPVLTYRAWVAGHSVSGKTPEAVLAGLRAALATTKAA